MLNRKAGRKDPKLTKAQESALVTLRKAGAWVGSPVGLPLKPKTALALVALELVQAAGGENYQLTARGNRMAGDIIRDAPDGL